MTRDFVWSPFGLIPFVLLAFLAVPVFAQDPPEPPVAGDPAEVEAARRQRSQLTTMASAPRLSWRPWLFAWTSSTTPLSLRIQLPAPSDSLETVAPEVALRAHADCPQCEAPNEIWLDPYISVREHGGDLLEEIHTLASAYHWSEAEILRLPRSRRQAYLRLVERARGVA